MLTPEQVAEIESRGIGTIPHAVKALIADWREMRELKHVIADMRDENDRVRATVLKYFPGADSALGMVELVEQVCASAVAGAKAMGAVLSAEFAENERSSKDTKRLDRLDSDLDLGSIEPKTAFPDGKWTIWKGDGSGEVLGRGETIRETIDAIAEPLRRDSDATASTSPREPALQPAPDALAELGKWIFVRPAERRLLELAITPNGRWDCTLEQNDDDVASGGGKTEGEAILAAIDAARRKARNAK